MIAMLIFHKTRTFSRLKVLSKITVVRYLWRSIHLSFLRMKRLLAALSTG